MREEFQNFNNRLVTGSAKIISNKGYNAILKHVEIDGIFTGFMDMLLFPVPANFFVFAAEDHFCINKKKLPKYVKCFDRIRFCGRVHKYIRKNGSHDYAIDDFVLIEKIDTEEFFRKKLNVWYCREFCENRDYCFTEYADNLDVNKFVLPYDRTLSPFCGDKYNVCQLGLFERMLKYQDIDILLPIFTKADKMENDGTDEETIARFINGQVLKFSKNTH